MVGTRALCPLGKRKPHHRPPRGHAQRGDGSVAHRKGRAGFGRETEEGGVSSTLGPKRAALFENFARRSRPRLGAAVRNNTYEPQRDYTPIMHSFASDCVRGPKSRAWVDVFLTRAELLENQVPKSDVGRNPTSKEASMTASSLPQRARAAEFVVIAALALPLLVRAVAGFTSGAWLWGFDALRYLPAWAWLVWASAVVAMALAVRGPSRGGRRALPAATWIAAFAVTALVLAFPDRVQFVGDFLLRQGTSEEALPPATLFPQALPLDVFLHVVLPTWAHASATVVSRIVDALEACALTALGFAFARRARLKG